MNYKSDIFMIIITAELFTNVTSQQNTQDLTETKIQKYCGRNLVNILTLVCDGVYNQMTPQRDGEVEVWNDLEVSGSKLSEIRLKREILPTTIMPNSFRRIRRGAYDECCRKGCSISEMLGYCGYS